MATPEGMIELDTGESWDLLRATQRGGVGRIAVSILNHPDIFPINFMVDEPPGAAADAPLDVPAIVFKTAEGTKLAAAVLGVAVAFEIDGYDPARGEAWSVVVKGQAHEIERRPGSLVLDDLALFPWHNGPKHRFVRIHAEEITGRRFLVVEDHRPAN